MTISVKPTKVPDVLIIEPNIYRDNRGYFFESFNQNDFLRALDKKLVFVQDNHSSSKRGVLRGLHYQTEKTQGKLVRVCYGSVFSVAVDLRIFSKTYGQWVGEVISAENKKQIWIPEGFAHGFLVLSEWAELLYKTTDYWHAGSEQCLKWNDPVLNINWPNMDINPILSPRDLQGLSWNECKKFE